MRPPAFATSSQHQVGRAAALALAALLLLPGAARAASYWVGNGGNPPCTHDKLQEALNAALGAPGDDLIYLVGPGPFTGPFFAFAGGIEIVGNVASCGSTDSVGFSTLRAEPGDRPLNLTVIGAATQRLRHLVVTTEGHTILGDGGGIHFAGSGPDSRLELVDSRVTGSVTAGIGGGIFVTGGRLLLRGGSLVAGNSANTGGGVAAADGAIVELDGVSVVVNSALFDGGGIHVQGTAVLAMGSSGDEVTMVNGNVAGRFGGGLYLLGEGEHRISSEPGAPAAAVSGNEAQRGGGLFVDEASLRLGYVAIDHNEATLEGGGVMVLAGGNVVANPLGTPPVVGGFPRFEANAAATGSALHVDHGAVVLAAGRIHGHSDGDAPLLSSLSGVLFLHGLTIDGNAASTLFRVDSVVLTLEHLSLAGNQVDGILGWRGGQAEITASALALDETEPFFASTEPLAGAPVVSCVVTRHASTFAVVPAGTVLDNLLVADPQFLAPPHELHLRHTSPAIDRCFAHPRLDLDGDVRGHDDPYHPNEPDRTADAGADEATVLFVDGFESGERGAWSAAFP
jgi:hypothetical protein